ncbi:NADH-ubiquinone oxidoreductase-F iron-sulfur binding region domain-containing protein [Parasporobacterium paucivorans]|uniref:NADH-quinone oxidoreductase subunit F n=1 Tax=Parasporobacterium paucivorans DSM 15970 TaxID=1122934 RepID=A0A1M6BXH4_9FIRM|nr:NADH-ubiquinone oxidoreductase-F iron-sulfur binding region domain-containing protein [Parasporobacterium paucivorans]SHI53321.1 NADH-quinone oxidoreductase subunit F [Parasporobacterium paucivorans DSM 15970]
MTGLMSAKKQNREEVLNKIEEKGFTDYGHYAGKLLSAIWSDAVQGAADERKKLRIAAALNNCDYDAVLISVLENNLAEVLEGMAIAAYALGTTNSAVYLPSENDGLADRIMEMSKGYGLDMQIEVGIVDTHITNTNPFYNANGHFETYAALSAFFSDPETYRPSILLAVKRGEVLEGFKKYPLGVTVKKVVGDIAEEDIMALEIGTKIFDRTALDVKIDAAFQPENGVVSVLGPDVCMIDQAVVRMEKICYKSCGKCTFCREGSRQLHAIFKEMTAGKGSASDLALVKEIVDAMEFSTLCSVGKTAANPVIGVLANFDDEIEDHIKRKKCRTDTCKAFMNIYIDPMKCEGCGDCVDECPADCIEGDEGYIHMIDDLECTKCGKCIEACEYEAIVRASGRLPKLPEKLTKVGKFKKR